MTNPDLLLLFATALLIAADLGRLVPIEAVRAATWVSIGVALAGMAISTNDGSVAMSTD